MDPDTVQVMGRVVAVGEVTRRLLTWPGGGIVTGIVGVGAAVVGVVVVGAMVVGAGVVMGEARKINYMNFDLHRV